MSQFKQLPSPYSKYEVSESGSILRSIKTKSIVNVEKGTSSYRLYSDDEKDKRISLSKEKLLEFCKPKLLKSKEEESKEKPQKLAGLKKEPKIQKEKNSKQEEKTVVKSEVDSIVSLGASNYVKSYKLHVLGYSKKQIAEFTGVKVNSVSRDLWLVEKGHRPKPE